MRNLVFGIFAVMFTAFAPALALVAQEKPEVGEVALVLAKPWRGTADEIVALSDASEVSPVQPPLGVFVKLETEDTVEQLYQNGAWVVVNGEKVLELCAY